ncbi:MAG: hypothetical protein RIG26_09845 [Thalassospira sp.]|uniref:hypothetical protein n=1 Tax=Thalassospira sp. TaxID=1912094 RepID=UPI0032EB2ECA
MGDAKSSIVIVESLITFSKLDTKRIKAIVAFLKTLTDARYEPLLAEQEAAAKN